MLVTTAIFSSVPTSAAFFDRLKGQRVLTGRTGAERGVIQRFRALEVGFMPVVTVVEPYLKLSQQHHITLEVQNSCGTDALPFILLFWVLYALSII